MKPFWIKTLPFSGDTAALFRLFSAEKNLFFLDSNLTGGSNSRYSFLGFNPVEIIEGKENSSDFRTDLCE